MRFALKMASGICAHCALFSFISILWLFLSTMKMSFESHTDLNALIEQHVDPYASYLLLLSLFTALAIIFFVVYLIKNTKFTSTQRTTWMISLFLIGALAAPVFYWIVFWHHRNSDPLFKSC